MEPNSHALSGPPDRNADVAKYFLAAIVESSQDSIVTIDLHRVVTSWNKAAERLYGYSAMEAIGQPLAVVMLPEDILELIKNMQKIMHEVSVPIYETVRLHKNGKTADLEIALSPVRDATGAVIGVSTIARDITEAKLQKQLKDEFIAVASHELKTPVTILKAYAQLLLVRLKEATDPTSFSMLTKLHLQVDRLSDLIKTLLDTTRLSGGELLLNLQSFDLDELIEEQVETLQRVSPGNQIVYAAQKGDKVTADRKLIDQVLTNLLANAVKYSPNGGEVIVRLSRTPEQVHISIQDFGMGIPDGLSNKVFERYFRVNQVPGAIIPGIGLGLYITGQIVQQHGGTISVESTEGIGSRFSFNLPQARARQTIEIKDQHMQKPKQVIQEVPASTD